MKRLLVAFIIATIPVLAAGQAIPTSKIGWDQEAPTLADAQGYTYKYYPDNAPSGVTLSGVVCSGAASPFTCTAPFPAFTPGNHSITMTAANLAGESAKTSPLDFTFIVTPSTPARIRIIGG